MIILSSQLLATVLEQGSIDKIPGEIPEGLLFHFPFVTVESGKTTMSLGPAPSGDK